MPSLKYSRYVLVLWAILFLGSCTSSTTQENPGETPSALPHRGGTVVQRVNSEPGNLNRLQINNVVVQNLETYYFQAMINLDFKTMKFEPQLAESLAEFSEDGKRLSFTFRKEARWADGVPVTPEDYLFTFKLMFLPEVTLSNFRDYYSFLEDIQIDPSNPLKVNIFLKERYFHAEAAFGATYIYPRHTWDPDNLLGDISFTDLRNNPSQTLKNQQMKDFITLFSSEKYQKSPEIFTGSGPYRLKVYEPGQKVELERVDGWWGDSIQEPFWMWKAYPDKIIIRPIPEIIGAVAELKALSLDICTSIPSEEFISLQESGGLVTEQYHFIEQPMLVLQNLIMNCRPEGSGRAPFFNDLRVRQAMAALLDLDLVIDAVYHGKGEIPPGPLPSGLKDFVNPNLAPVRYNPEKAKALLSEAGWEDTDGDGIRDKMINGKKVALAPKVMHSNTSESAAKMVALYKTECLKAGIDLLSETYPFANVTEFARKHDFDMLYMGSALPPLSPDFKETWHSESWTSGGGNYSGLAVQELDSLIDLSRVELSDAKRIPLGYRIQQIIVENQPYIWVITPGEKMAVRKTWNGVETFSPTPNILASTLWETLVN